MSVKPINPFEMSEQSLLTFQITFMRPLITFTDHLGVVNTMSATFLTKQIEL